MKWIDFWRTDSDACTANPKHMFVYNRMELLCEQGITAWPLPCPPTRYPVAADFIMALDEEDTSIIITDEVEYHRALRSSGGGAGWFWAETSKAQVYILDAIIHLGSVRCEDTFSVTTSSSGLPLAYEHRPGYSVPPSVLQLMSQILCEYTGPLSLRIQEDIVTDCRLRWSSPGCIWHQQIDFVKTAPAYVASTRQLRPLIKPLVYVPCWVDDDHQDTALEAGLLEREKGDLPVYEANRTQWKTCGVFVRIGVFAVHPSAVSTVEQLKRAHGWT
jgi:hypothetical protein